jgi:hypothetical protein
MTTPALDLLPHDTVEADGLAEVLAQHGMDPRHDSRFHVRRSRGQAVSTDTVGAIVHAGLGLTLALVAASATAGGAVAWSIALVTGVVAMWASIRLQREDGAVPAVEIILAMVGSGGLALLSCEAPAPLDALVLSPFALVSACIAAGGALLVGAAMLTGSPQLRFQARIFAPVCALAATLAVA